MTCALLQPQLTALLDGELLPDTAAEAERHLENCPGCTQVRAELIALVEMAGAWTEETPDISSRVMQAVTSDDSALLLGEMQRLRAEMQELRAEVAALRGQLSRRSEMPQWTPPARPDYAKDYPRMENDPWNLTRS